MRREEAGGAGWGEEWEGGRSQGAMLMRVGNLSMRTSCYFTTQGGCQSGWHGGFEMKSDELCDADDLANDTLLFMPALLIFCMSWKGWRRPKYLWLRQKMRLYSMKPITYVHIDFEAQPTFLILKRVKFPIVVGRVPLYFPPDASKHIPPTTSVPSCSHHPPPFLPDPPHTLHTLHRRPLLYAPPS